MSDKTKVGVPATPSTPVERTALITQDTVNTTMALCAQDNEVLTEEMQQNLSAMGASAAQLEHDAGLGGGKFFTTAGGILKWDDNPLPGNTLICIVLDNILEYSYYEKAYHSDNIISPACFALGRDVDLMAPHTKAMSKQHTACSDCALNKWGSADVGRGKKCSNRRRLALIPAGSFSVETGITLFPSLDMLQESEIGYLRLPVTSVKAFSQYVTKINTLYKRPPFGMITRLTVDPHPEHHFKLSFTAVNKVSAPLLKLLMERHQEAASMIDFPYLQMDEQDQSDKPTAKY